MPFTFSHPAAVLPLLRTRLPMTALIVGSMVPDLPYFLTPTRFDQYGHTLPGVFFYCIPAGLVVLLVFHHLLFPPLSRLLPESHQARLFAVVRPLLPFAVGRLLLLSAGIVVGAFTHIVWDSFTHGHGWTVEHLPILQSPILETKRGPIPLFKLLQHGSTLVGATAMAFSYRWWYRTAVPAEEALPPVLPRPLALGMLVGIVLFGIATSLAVHFLRLRLLPDGIAAEDAIINLVVVTITAISIALILYSLAYWLRLRINKPGHRQ